VVDKVKERDRSQGMAKLRESLESLEDPRNASGRRHSFVAVLSLILAALLAGQRSLQRIAAWGSALSVKAKETLGFPKKTPCAATLSNLLRRVDLKALEDVFGQYVLTDGDSSGDHVAMDGKTVHGSAQGGVPAVHLLSLFLSKNNGVINQMAMETGENEITTAIRLLENSAIDGKIITGDAMFSQKKFVQ
jgi:hypothetical protein